MVHFTSEQKKAVYNIIMLLMMIDGHITIQEGDYWRKVGTTLGMSEMEKRNAVSMDQNVAVSILRSMPAENKIAAIKIFSNMMDADGKIDLREARLFENLFDDMDCVTAANSIGKNALDDILKSFS